MKKILSLFFALLTVSVMNAKVAFLVPANNTNRDALRFEEVDGVEQSPERRAYDWFKTTFVDPGNGQFISLNDLGSLPADINAIWIYVDRVGFNAGDFDNLFNATVKANLQAFLNAGGNLFLGKQATRLEKDLVGATDGQSSTPGEGNVITPAYNDGGYRDPATWGVSTKFFDGDGWGSYKGHRIYKDAPRNQDNEGYLELIWTDNRKLTDNNCGMEIGWMGLNDVNDRDHLVAFQTRNNCKVLGGWANGNGCHYGGIIEFYPTGDRKGTVLMIGLASYSWITNNDHGWGYDNTEAITRGALEYLNAVPALAWNTETVQTSGVIGEDHYMTASATTGYTVRYAADHPEIANIGNEDGRVFYNYFGSTTFHATATGDGWNVPKATATIASETITVTGGDAATYAYVLPYSLHVMANYDNEEGRRPDYEAAQWFHDQFISGNVGGEHGCFVRPSDLGSLNSAIKILWIHNDHVGKASGDYYNDLGGDSFRDNLAAFVNAGGNVFVSKQATRLVGDLGRNDYPSYNNGGYADRGPWRVGNKWNFEIGGEIDHSTHRVFSNMGTNTTIMALGRHTDNNCIWQNFAAYGSNDKQRLTQYELDHNCVVLGGWGHDHNNGVNGLLECVGFVEYNPTAAGHGIIIAMGLASYHWADPTNAIKTLTLNTLSYLNFMNARPCASDNSTPMETKLAEDGFYPSETQSFLKLHPVCENMAATYTLTSNPNNIARIQENVQVGEETITQLQFKAAGTVTLHIVLTETRTNVNWPTGTYEYDREITFSYPYDSPRAFDNTAMADKLADAYFYPANTTTFRTLHPVCEGIGATYTLTDPNNIARIQEDVQVGEATITQLQFQSAGTVTLHVTLTENREYMYWPTGVYNYNREITFAYANANAAQDAVNQDFPGNGWTAEGEPATQMAMRLHPSVRRMDSLSYTITNHYDNTQGEAYKKTEDGVTRLYFSKSGKVLLTIRLNEPNWREEWTPGVKELERVIEFNFAQDAGPALTWPSVFETGAVDPNSVITLPETAEGLPVTYTVEGDASLDGNVLTLANVESGSVTVQASVTVSEYQATWPLGTYIQEKTLSFHASEVAYLLPAAESIDHMAGWYDGEQPEYNAAKWFQDNYIATGKGRFVTVDELPTLYAKGIKTLWVNIERIGITTEEGMFSAMPEGLKTYIQAGGNVLLTKQATRLAYLMERIGYAPEFNADGYVTTNEDNLRSISTLMGTAGCVDERLDMSGHRIYNDMLSYFEGKNMFFVGPDCKKTYNYCSWQDFMRSSDQDTHYDNCLIQRVRDFEQDWHATVFGIQGNIGDYCFSNIVEFNATGAWQGRILTIGSAAYQWGTSNNGVERENLKTLTANCLAYLANEDVPDEVYTRDVTPDKFGTICWGYAVEAGNIEGAEIYELTSFDETGNAILLTEVTSMVAGRPYFFLATSDQLRLTYNGQKAEGSSYNGLVGYIAMPGAEPFYVPNNGHSYILYNNELVKVDQDDIELPSNKAYVNSETIPAYQTSYSPMRQRRMAIIHQTPTDIEAVEREADGHVYDILGRKLQAPQAPGVYIKDGKKVLIIH